jgi:hypothetical protein
MISEEAEIQIGVSEKSFGVYESYVKLAVELLADICIFSCIEWTHAKTSTFRAVYLEQ